jgi:hypothetical protein
MLAGHVPTPHSWKRPRSRSPPNPSSSWSSGFATARLTCARLTCTPRRLPGFSPFKASRSEAVPRLCMGDGRDQEPAANEARRSARSVAPPGLSPRRRRRKARMGSRRVPTEFPPGRTYPRKESEFRGADPARPGTSGNSRGTEWGLIWNRDPSGSSRTGTERGLGPFTIEQTTEEVTAIHRLAASRLRGRRLSRHRPPARSTSGDPREGRRHGP